MSDFALRVAVADVLGPIWCGLPERPKLPHPAP